jgi:hypothetical protein
MSRTWPASAGQYEVFRTALATMTLPTDRDGEYSAGRHSGERHRQVEVQAQPRVAVIIGVTLESAKGVHLLGGFTFGQQHVGAIELHEQLGFREWVQPAQRHRSR